MNIKKSYRRKIVSQQSLETILLKYKELVETGYKIRHMTGAKGEISQIANALIMYPVIMDSGDVEPQSKKIIQQGLQGFLTDDNKPKKELTDLAIKYYSSRLKFGEQLENSYSGVKEILALKVIKSLLSERRYFDYRSKKRSGYYDLFIQDLEENGYKLTLDPKTPDSIQIGKIVKEETISYNGEEYRIYQISTEEGIDFFNDGVEDLLNCIKQGNNFIINKSIIDKAARNLIPKWLFEYILFKSNTDSVDKTISDIQNIKHPFTPIIISYLKHSQERDYQNFVDFCIKRLLDNEISKIKCDLNIT